MCSYIVLTRTHTHSTLPCIFPPPNKHAIKVPLCPLALSKHHHFLLPPTAFPPHKEELKREKGPRVVSIDTNNCCIWQITGHSTESKMTLSNSLYWEEARRTDRARARRLSSQLSPPAPTESCIFYLFIFFPKTQKTILICTWIAAAPRNVPKHSTAPDELTHLLPVSVMRQPFHLLLLKCSQPRRTLCGAIWCLKIPDEPVGAFFVIDTIRK